jgi:hypothetical protein
MQLRNDEQVWGAAILELSIRELRLRAAAQNPAFFLHWVDCVDSRSGDLFHFQLLKPDEIASIYADPRDLDWHWQREYLDWILANDQTITLKGRQLGVTWVWAGLALWTAMFRPGADVLVYSIKEDDAGEVIGRIWDMFLSLPEPFASMVEVLKPIRGIRPSNRIEFRHPDGRISTISGMVATRSAGHGRSAALVVFDEASRQEYARDLWKAVVPAMGDKGGRLGVVSTANGMSDGKGKGNFFHELWAGAGHVNYPKLHKTFLGWDLHPGRDARWYDHVSLPEAEKAEQYPNDADEAFLLSGTPFFSSLSLRRYAQRKASVLIKAEWRVNPLKPAQATLHRGEGPIEVYQEPEAGKKYAIGADVATGRGTDFSVGAVIDLHDGTPCAELYMKGEYELFTEQLHFLGLWYNAARIAPEMGGGYGDTVVAYLRDGLKGRKPYPRIYRHRPFDRTDRPQSVRLGFPMTAKTRPKVINELRVWLEDDLLPWIPPGLFAECQTFVHREVKPSPRAQDGCNDDRVMAWAIALELFSEFGEHQFDRRKVLRTGVKKQKTSGAKRLYPWNYD